MATDNQKPSDTPQKTDTELFLEVASLLPKAPEKQNAAPQPTAFEQELRAAVKKATIEATARVLAKHGEVNFDSYGLKITLPPGSRTTPEQLLAAAHLILPKTKGFTGSAHALTSGRTCIKIVPDRNSERFAQAGRELAEIEKIVAPVLHSQDRAQARNR